MGGLRRMVRFTPLTWTTIFAAVALALFVHAPFASAQQASPAEYRIKAAFLYHFCNYVDWPPSAFTTPDSPLLIGVTGSSKTVEQLHQEIGGRRVRGRRVIIQQVDPEDSLDALHVLYFTRTTRAATYDLMARPDHPVLVVTESENVVDGGGIINFVIEDDRVRFDVRLDAAKERGLKVGAQLLTVAREIRGDSS